MLTSVIFIGMGVKITVYTSKYPETLYFTGIIIFIHAQWVCLCVNDHVFMLTCTYLFSIAIFFISNSGVISVPHNYFHPSSTALLI